MTNVTEELNKVSTSADDSTNYPDIYSTQFEELLKAIKNDYDKRMKQGENENPFEAIRLIKEFRLGALLLPKDEGGSESTLVDVFTAIIRIAEVDPDVAHILRAHYIFVEDLLEGERTVFKRKILQEVGKGALLGNAITEISKHASGSFKYNTTLTKVDNHYVLDGKKYFCTGTLYADYTVVVAMIDEEVATVIVPVSREGVTTEDDWDGIGQKLTGSGTTTFKNVYVNADELVGGEEIHAEYASLAQLYLQAIVAGILKNIVSDAVALIEKRTRAFSHSNNQDLKQDVQLQQVVGELSSYAYAAESMVLTAAKSQDNASSEQSDTPYGHTASVHAAQTKVAIEQLAFKAATLLFEVGGASATKQSANLDRHWRNIRTLSSHNPTLYKARALGDYYINNEYLPANSYF